MWGAHEGMGWWMLFGSVSWLAFAGILVYLFTSAFGRDSRPQAGWSGSPFEIAQRRLAAGEISNEESERIRDTLSR